MEHDLQLPLTKEMVSKLVCGDSVVLTGILYTARDAAHKRLVQQIEKGDALPFALKGAVLYYMGPTPAKPGQVIGSAGPTTSGRMDSYTPLLLHKGLRGMIGKGRRSSAVVEAMVEEGAVYFAAIGGAGALLAQHITESSVVAYEDLGAEAIYRLKVNRFPVIVAIDSRGNSLYR